MDDYYTKHGPAYSKRTFSLDSSEFLDILSSRLQPGAKILDAGCGSGRDLLWFSQKGFSPIGFERSFALARLAKIHSGCPVVCGDFSRFDFSRFQCSGLLSSGSLVHIRHEALPGILENLCTALCKNGLFLLSLKKGAGSYQGTDGRTFYLWQDNTLRNIFAEQELEITQCCERPSFMGTGEIWLEYLLVKK